MVQTFYHLVQYNQQVNQELFQILSQLPKGDLHKERGSYYGSILGILHHILVSDYHWLGRFAAQGLCSPPKLTEVEAAFHGDLAYETLEGWLAARQSLDALYSEIQVKMTLKLWDQGFEYKNSQGQTIEQPLGLLLLHLFNHMTHHRGQISQILDEAGIPHDFSGIRQRFTK